MAAKPDVARGELSIDDLKRQLEETQQHQAATSELLELIRRSSSDFQAVLDALMAAAARLCGVEAGGVAVREGEAFRYLATVGMNAEFDAVMRGRTYVPGRGTTVGRVALEKRVIHIVDVLTDPEYEISETVTLGRLRTILSVPMMRDGDVVGAITLTRRQVEPFSEPQIALIKTFADQAVIAMENARLLMETREALEQQTATADILRVISSSPADVQPTFDAIAASAARLCEAEFSAVARVEDGLLHLAATNNLSPEESSAFHSLFPRPPSRSFALGRAFVDGCAVQLDDVLAEADYDSHTREVLQTKLGYRTF